MSTGLVAGVRPGAPLQDFLPDVHVGDDDDDDDGGGGDDDDDDLSSSGTEGDMRGNEQRTI